VPPHALESPATQIVRMPQSLSHAHAVWQVSLVSHVHGPGLVQSGSHAQPAWQPLDVLHAQPPVVTQRPAPVSQVRPGSQPPPAVQAQPSDPIEQLPPSSPCPLPPPPQPPSTSATSTTILMADAVSRLRVRDNSVAELALPCRRIPVRTSRCHKVIGGSGPSVEQTARGHGIPVTIQAVLAQHLRIG